jgi:hypothetical protein
VFAGGGEGIDTDKAKAWGITRLWYESSDPVASAKSLRDCIGRGVNVGLKVNGGGVIAAQAMDTTLTAHGFTKTSSPYTCAAMFDDEPIESTSTLQMLQAWRKLRPTRWTVLTIEGFQGGRIDPALATFCNADPNLIVVPQAYLNDEYPSWVPAVQADAILAGLVKPDVFISSADRIPYGWQGIIWGFARLPATPPRPL